MKESADSRHDFLKKAGLVTAGITILPHSCCYCCYCTDTQETCRCKYLFQECENQEFINSVLRIARYHFKPKYTLH